MTFDVKKLALAAAITMAVVYVVCAVFVSLFPGVAVKFLGWMLHIVNIEKIAGDVQVTPVGVLAGLVQTVGYTYFGIYLFGWLYNRFVKPAPTPKA